MGVKDQGLQEYLKDNERFADFMNGTLFAGKQIVDPRYLKEVQRKKRVSYKQSIMAKIYKRKTVLKNTAKRKLPGKKVFLKRQNSGMTARSSCIWKENAIFYVCTTNRAVDFFWHVKLSLGQTMRCL
mgnify:CR=1 FL=1